ncbi:MAG: hypothetical protein NTV34_16315 [Proteobacteria bacterium]|nr:hypothetical protein [Pseudomonadota bacterium]
MSPILEVLLIGVAATLAMTGVLAGLHGSSLNTADMIRALGSIFTRNQVFSFTAGMFAYTIMGCLSAFLYVAVWSTFDFAGVYQLTALGAVIGLAQGIFLSFLLIVFVAEHHKLARFRKMGFGVAVAFLVAYVVYGAVVGWGVGKFGSRFASLERWQIKTESKL